MQGRSTFIPKTPWLASGECTVMPLRCLWYIRPESKRKFQLFEQNRRFLEFLQRPLIGKESLIQKKKSHWYCLENPRISLLKRENFLEILLICPKAVWLRNSFEKNVKWWRKLYQFFEIHGIKWQFLQRHRESNS